MRYNIGMSKKILTYTSFYEAGEAAVRAVAGRKVTLGVRHLLIVPDKYTLYYEKRLFSGGGAFDAEVVTLNRLFQRVIRPDGAYLSRQGAIMLLRGIISENEAKLRCFGRSARFKGFAEKLYNVFTQTESSGVDISALTGEGALGVKLEDLRLLYAAYKSATKGRYTDAAGRLELLRRGADCPYVRESHIYVTGFFGETRQTRDVIDALAKAAKSLTVFKCEPVSGKADNAFVYAAPDNVTALKAVARRINNLVYGGARYGDMCVVTSAAAELKRIFTEHNIPFFADNSSKLIAHPLAGYVSAALDCVRRGYKRSDMIKLAKNPCSGIDRRDADELENYCNAFLVEYLGFFRPFSEKNVMAERARTKLARLIEPFALAVKSADGPEAFCAAVSELVSVAVCESDGAADKIEGLLGQLKELLPVRCSVRLAEECFAEGLASAKVGQLPAYSDTVTVGMPEVFRGQRYGHVFIVGFNDGELPAFVNDEGLLSDSECAALDCGIEPTTAEINARAAEEIRQIACDAPDLFITVADGNVKPSGVLKAMLGNGCVKSSYAEESAALRMDDELRSSLTLDMCADRASALELMITGARDGIPTASSVAAAVDGAEKYLNPRTYDCETVDSRGLYFKDGNVGVTELGSYFSCPRMHFYAYGLRLKKRDTGEMTGLDVGNFLHSVAERFAALPKERQTAATARVIAAEIARSQPKYILEANAGLADRVCDEAVRLCAVIKNQLDAGSYDSYALEAGFGPDGRFPPLELSTGSTDVRLSGKIDRVDTGDGFARVIDYKTGSTRFSFSEVYYGRQLQLPLYMRVALDGIERETGVRPQAGGMFYFPFRIRWSDADEDYRLDGLFDSSPRSLTAHDGGFLDEEKHKSTVIKCSGVYRDGILKTYRPPKTAVTGEYIDSVCDYAVAAASRAADEIYDGYAAPAPLVASDKTPCAYCDYRDMCMKKNPRYALTGGPPDIGGGDGLE